PTGIVTVAFSLALEPAVAVVGTARFASTTSLAWFAGESTSDNHFNRRLLSSLAIVLRLRDRRGECVARDAECLQLAGQHPVPDIGGCDLVADKPALTTRIPAHRV